MQGLRKIDAWFSRIQVIQKQTIKSLTWLVVGIVFLYLALANYYRLLAVPQVNNHGAVIGWTIAMIFSVIRALKLRVL